jgi:hypothetical protein
VATFRALRSELGIGTTFSVFLPLANRCDTAAEAAEASSGAPAVRIEPVQKQTDAEILLVQSFTRELRPA